LHQAVIVGYGFGTMLALFYPNRALSNPWNWTWLDFSGPDSVDFLNRLSSINIKRLPIGNGRECCFLSANGKLLSYFWLWRYEENSFGIELEGGSESSWIQSTLNFIDHYTFSEQVTVQNPSSNLDCVWIFSTPDSQLDLEKDIQPNSTVELEDEVRVCRHGGWGDKFVGEDGQGWSWMSVWARPARLSQWLDQTVLKNPNVQTFSTQEIESSRIRGLNPRMDFELTTETIPLEAGLLGSIDRNKGCYPGQEVIERIFTYGAPARRLCLLQNKDTSAVVGSIIFKSTENGPLDVGKITSLNQNNQLALGWIKKLAAKPDQSLENFTLLKVSPYEPI
jgi:folate-binding protein YgfZ